jgi:hypothetical protein
MEIFFLAPRRLSQSSSLSKSTISRPRTSDRATSPCRANSPTYHSMDGVDADPLWAT